MLGLGAGVVISSRVADSRSAQQIGGLLVLPIVFLIVGQITGLFVLGPSSVLAAAVVLLILDILVLRLGVRVFDREKIISQWK
jgi:ABC-2 type transport system permease protein